MEEIVFAARRSLTGMFVGVGASKFTTAKVFFIFSSSPASLIFSVSLVSAFLYNVQCAMGCFRVIIIQIRESESVVRKARFCGIQYLRFEVCLIFFDFFSSISDDSIDTKSMNS